jgi:hypothetical protein
VRPVAREHHPSLKPARLEAGKHSSRNRSKPPLALSFANTKYQNAKFLQDRLPTLNLGKVLPKKEEARKSPPLAEASLQRIKS